ncbi:hypothetical protein CA85_29180 [Allorhodopirellula solitaria]|uniref:Uncharacterized protein n=1 Tax=Allorhodopirellula solitaria TaxID=2527987 RepID=A0A5C5XS36_9BACT|nr:hypothetical protein CA85_29180 [Allorhodopirellula solitaria]
MPIRPVSPNGAALFSSWATTTLVHSDSKAVFCGPLYETTQRRCYFTQHSFRPKGAVL